MTIRPLQSIYQSEKPCERCGAYNELHVHGEHSEHLVFRCAACDPPCGWCQRKG